jgi:hypothetical protein
MSVVHVRRALTAAATIVALVGVVDAARGGQPDLAVLFGVLAGLLVALLATSWSRRRPVEVRADLARWVDDRGALTGEPGGRIADRAIAEHRARLELDPPSGRRGPDVATGAP